jgi:hypothetical protein
MSRERKKNQKKTERERKRYGHAMVVLILPTLVRREIFANSIAKAGVSTILSLRTFEHFGELYSALT